MRIKHLLISGLATVCITACGGAPMETTTDDPTQASGKGDNASSSSASQTLQSAIDALNKIDGTVLSQNDQLLFDIAKTKLQLVMQQLGQNDPVPDLTRQLTAVQTLVGSFIDAPGSVFTGGPQLKSSATVTVSADLGSLIQAIFGSNVRVGATVTYSNASDVAAKYNAAKAQYVAVLGQMLVYESRVHPIVAASLAWARSQYVFSQPDCINIAGWGYRQQCD